MKTIRLLISIITFALSMDGWCDGLVVNGIKYSINEDNASLTVVAGNYIGDIAIPSSITFNKKSYSVTSIGSSAFSHCLGLTSITIPNSVASIGSSAFEGCSGLTSVTIPNSVTSIGESAFYNCSGITSVTIPNSVTSIGLSAFAFCSGLTSVTIPNSVTNFGRSAFSHCSGLTSVTIQEGVTSIGIMTFYECSGLTSVTIPNSVTTIGKMAFSGCSGLTSVTIPSSVTSIGESAFYNCSGLTSVTIPNSVTSIGESAFAECYCLNTLICDIETPIDINSSTFMNKSKCVLYVPIGCVDAYKAEETWRGFAEIREIDETVAIDNVAIKGTNATDTIYNLRCQKVGGNYKGIVIKNGKKFFAK